MQVSFDEVLEDITRLGTKVAGNEYQDQGDYPIIDQGQQFISGYLNESQGLLDDLPVIIFGDHTRVLKYVDFPFFLGADGVKVLKVKDNRFLSKYVYYNLCAASIPNTGYNRHFKWLKQVKLKLCSPEDQKKVVESLDKITDLTDKRKRQLEKLDLLVKLKFNEAFDFNSTPVISIEEAASLITKGTTPTTLGFKFVESGINFIKVENIDDTHEIITDKLMKITAECNDKLNRSKLMKGDILFSIAGAIGRLALVTDEALPANTNQALAIIRIKEKFPLNKIYFINALESPFVKEQYMKMQRGIAQINLSLKNIAELKFPLPDMTEQNEFARFVERVDEAKIKIKQSLEKLQTLKKALMQKYFG